ncbi:U2 small nuclear ribonucleoprotein auxiliary factor 35 kDa subunit-related protein 2 [Sitophilus oryzae]|uniref:U2 small nuclear ribonucleoprotein auxiliary factor 35 kDa subunit-related protein 2 n=1 Tax=Sitophilus oryzae TaxID=7048 RepID=A0A6J2XDF9_SITOR|nr:U2 small nuclear ribonucleoprotein auxiliary factor 35 kDa subunit-related protein 2 [Sitophilus oryzae]
MGKHEEWRKLAKKLRRKKIRQIRAKERDLKLEEDQRKLIDSPHYQQWIQQQEIIEQEKEEEELRQSALNDLHWRKVEKEAQKQWQELQKKLALAREEKMKQNIKIRMEWEREQEKLKELKIAKEKQLELKRIQQEEREKLLLDFLEHGGETPEHLKAPLETNPGKQICPFFEKVSACRFFDSCSRNHVRPGISKTILITNFFTDISLEAKENEHGSDSSLEFEREDTYAHYRDFFFDVVPELEKCGKIRNFYTCCNHESHLRGNVYVEYYTTRDALVSYHKFNGRWYAGRQLNVNFSKINSWKVAICGLFFQRKCPKGNSCNFLHIFNNPKNLYNHQEEERYRYTKSRHKKNSFEFEKDDFESWDSHSERRNWRWSESPEHTPRTELGKSSDSSHVSRRKSRTSKRRKHENYEDTKNKHKTRKRSRSRSRRSERDKSKRRKDSYRKSR